MLTGWKYLTTTKITTIIKELNGIIDSTKPLIFLNRTAVVNAFEDEIMGKYNGKGYIADILADDQTALVYESGAMTFSSNEVPKLKYGKRLGESLLNLLYRLETAGQSALQSDQLQFKNWQLQTAEECLNAIRQRMNQIICAMELDSYVYNRFGMQISAGWGTPANLKTTPSTSWDNIAATPIADLGAITNLVGPDNYGKTFNRATLSTKAFRYAIATTEMRNLISGLKLYNLQSGQLDVTNQTLMRGYFETFSGLALELYDGTYFERAANGAESQNRVLPSVKVILTNTADDNNRAVRDFANGIVTETIVGSIGGQGQKYFDAPDYGPVAYWAKRANLDPPDIVCYGVSRGFARKHDEYSTATLTVGSW